MAVKNKDRVVAWLPTYGNELGSPVTLAWGGVKSLRGGPKVRGQESGGIAAASGGVTHLGAEPCARLSDLAWHPHGSPRAQTMLASLLLLSI